MFAMDHEGMRSSRRHAGYIDVRKTNSEVWDTNKQTCRRLRCADRIGDVVQVTGIGTHDMDVVREERMMTKRDIGRIRTTREGMGIMRGTTSNNHREGKTFMLKRVDGNII